MPSGLGTVIPHSLIISTADWDRPIWTNKQYVARELAVLGPVTYINSLGLRRPALTRTDLERVLRRLAPHNASTQTTRAVDGVRTRSPWVIPWHRRSAPTWRLNCISLRRTARQWRRAAQGSRILWTFSPITYGLEQYADLTVYHCVDLLEHLHGVDALALLQGGNALRETSGLVTIASSSGIAKHLSHLGFEDVRRWENVADTDLISEMAEKVERQPNHTIFAGNLTSQKVDFPLMRRLVESERSVHLHLVGPVGEGGGLPPDIAWFQAHPRVELHGVLEPEALGQLLGACTVGLIPYIQSPYTDGVFPLKVYEYLAAGLAVVSTDLPALSRVSEVDVCANEDSFLKAVLSRIRSDDPRARAERVAVARKHSWATRGCEIRELVTSRLANTHGT